MSLLPSHSRVGGGVLKEVDLRRARRYSDRGSMIQASWIDAEGNVNVGMVRVLNISETGLALELPVVPQQAAMVRIQSDRHKLTGAAMVRHVSEQGSRCVVGLEFANGMKWTPPWEENPESSEREVLSGAKDERLRPTVTTTVGLQSTTVPVRPRLMEIKPPGANVVMMKAADAVEARANEPPPAGKLAEAVSALPDPSPLLDAKEAEIKPEELKAADEKPAEPQVVKTVLNAADGFAAAPEAKADTSVGAKAGTTAAAKADIPVGPKAETPVGPKAETSVAAKAETSVAVKGGTPAAAKTDTMVAAKAETSVAVKADTPAAAKTDRIVATNAFESLEAAEGAKALDAKAADAPTRIADAKQSESKPANPGASVSKDADAKPADSRPNESVPAESQPVSQAAEIAKAQKAAEPAPPDTAVARAEPAEPLAATPAPAVLLTAETVAAEPATAEPSKPPESPAENLDDFWGWTKQ